MPNRNTARTEQRGMDDDGKCLSRAEKIRRKTLTARGAFIKPEPVAKPQGAGRWNPYNPHFLKKMTIKELSDIMKVTPSTVIKTSLCVVR